MKRVLFLLLQLQLNLCQDCQSEAPSLPAQCPDDASPHNFPDLSECSRYWLCVGGCALNFQVNSIYSTPKDKRLIKLSNSLQNQSDL